MYFKRIFHTNQLSMSSNKTSLKCEHFDRDGFLKVCLARHVLHSIDTVLKLASFFYFSDTGLHLASFFISLYGDTLSEPFNTDTSASWTCLCLLASNSSPSRNGSSNTIPILNLRGARFSRRLPLDSCLPSGLIGKSHNTSVGNYEQVDSKAVVKFSLKVDTCWASAEAKAKVSRTFSPHRPPGAD